MCYGGADFVQKCKVAILTLMPVINIQTSNALRGIAILLVMLNHIIGKTGGAGTLYGAMGVALFFFLSGYGLQKSFDTKGRSGYWRKKMKRVWFPYVFLSVPIAIVQRQEIATILLDVTLLQPYYIYGWYLTALLVCYVAFYVFSFLCKYGKPIFIIYWFLFAIAVYLFGNDLSKANGLIFGFGVYCARYGLTCWENPKKGWFLVSLCISCVLFTYLLMSGEPLYWVTRNHIIQVLFAVVMIILCFRYSLHSSFLSWIGVISYELYIIHGWILDWYCGHRLIIILLVILVTFPLSLGYAKLMKKITK